MYSTNERKTAKQIVRYYFKDDTGNPFELTDGQADIFLTIFLKRFNRNEIIASTQYGKLLSDDTLVITANGWKKHGELKVGDYVFNENGRMVKVLNVFNEGSANLEVEFSNGEKIKCHSRHEFIVKSLYDFRRKYPFKILEAGELKKTLKTKKYSIPNIKSLDFGKKEKLPIDPYFLGAWLGDGSSSKCAITCQEGDDAIMKRIPYKISTQCVHHKTGIITYYFSRQKIVEKLRKLKLFKNKHIPDIYKYSSIKNRSKLIAGLIDTDGSVNKKTREKNWKNGRIYICNTNKTLIDDTVQILQSLGLRTTIVKVKACLSSSNIRGKKDVYYLGFQPFIDFPTVLPRKKIDVRVNKRHVTIKNIIKIKPVGGKCIEVEGGIYLAGKKLIPTHNSSVVAMALVVRTHAYGESFAIVTGQENKSQIIMEKVIQHTFDHVDLYSQLEIGDEPLERIRRERSKKRITWKCGGEIRTITADSRNRQRVKESLTGLGSPNIIEDEASLIPDDLQAMILRMLGGHKGGFLLKIGNPFYRNHFHQSWFSDKYEKIFIDYKQALKEGRYTKDFIDEMKAEAFFEILYECKFPTEDEIDDRGYRRLLTTEQIEASFIDEIPKDELLKNKKLGIDIGRGGNKNVFVLRTKKVGWIENINQSPDLMQQVARLSEIITKNETLDKTTGDKKELLTGIFIDDVGVGGGVTDRATERGFYVTGIREGGSAERKEKFKNQRAENFWDFRQWILGGGKLVKSKHWLVLAEIKYKVDSAGRLMIEPKEEMSRRASAMLKELGSTSPDVIDAGSLTMNKGNKPKIEWIG